MKTFIYLILILLSMFCYEVSCIAKDYESDIAEAAIAEGIDPKLLSSLCYIESKHNPNAINYDDGDGDSIGMCQIKVSTAKQFDRRATAKKLFNAKYNLKIAAKYLSYQIDRYHGDIRKAVLAYNAGSYIPKRTKKDVAVNEKYFKMIVKKAEESTIGFQN
jgi:soluble lytic murein transglycosylase-like protein